ncbi:MAG: DUF3536 domain-containing protein [Elusimicrobiota bacterium]
MNRYVCLHGHFYQLPRENPWLEKVELEDSAHPYHDWNERVTAECYAPNTASRILDPEGKIIDIVNNYQKMSFNFGPTLLHWMERNKPEVYRAIIEADKESRKRFSGHGAAIAQCYNHLIMPLANRQDKITQALWGIRDFEYRFGRRPEGMWLPEAAVDLETLEIIAGEGIKFTILSPHQAKRIRKIGAKEWIDVTGAKVDPRRPYVCRLPAGGNIFLFFYDGSVSQDIAFGDVLSSGENFARRLTGVFSEKQSPQLAHVATDGETYGHHYRHGDMALSYCLYYLEANNLAKVTIYAEYLEKHLPAYEAEIIENSSWSCIHGIERWRSNCGCNGGHGGWNQNWRAPLRGALDWLRDNLAPLYKDQLAPYLRDPWKARDHYIEIILDRSEENIKKFLAQHAVKELSSEEKIKVLKLLEMQRNSLLMYTSCGWFFDEITGIETVQIQKYAARAMQLAREISNMSLEDTFVNLLERAPSNIPEFKNGAKFYNNFIKPMILDLVRVGAHYAISSLFKAYPETAKIYCYTANNLFYEFLSSGKQKLAFGRTVISSEITGEKIVVSFAVLHLGDHNLIGGVREYMGEEAFSGMYDQIKGNFVKNDIPENINLMEKHFNTSKYSLWHLFHDEQRSILNQITGEAIKKVEVTFRQISDDHYPMLQVMKQLNIPLPKILMTTIKLTLITELQHLLEDGEMDFNQLNKVVGEIIKWNIYLDRVTLGFLAGNKINEIMEKLPLMPPGEVNLLEAAIKFFKALAPLSLPLNLWRAQNIHFYLSKKIDTELPGKEHDEKMKKVMEYSHELGKYLGVKTR